MITRSLFAVLALAACTDPRRIVLSIDTTAGVPCEVDRVRIRAASTTFERSLAGERLPLAITLLDDTRDGAFDLDIVALAGDAEVMRASGMAAFAGRELTLPVVLEPRCTVDAPCPLAEALPAGARVPTSVRPRCGPAVARYTAEPALASFQDACMVPGPHTGRVLVDGSRGPVRLDDLDAALPGFGFQFYGRPIHQVWVHRDGYISFARDNPDPDGDLDPGALDRDILGAGAAPPPQSVMAFWDRLTLRSQLGVCYVLDGQPGTQVLRVTWLRACLTDPCTTDSLNFTISLSEASQTIVLAYGDMIAGAADRARGATATVGLVNDATGCPASECAAATGACHDGTPCGYSQMFSRAIQMPGVPNVQFAPRPEP